MKVVTILAAVMMAVTLVVGSVTAEKLEPTYSKEMKWHADFRTVYLKDRKQDPTILYGIAPECDDLKFKDAADQTRWERLLLLEEIEREGGNRFMSRTEARKLAVPIRAALRGKKYRINMKCDIKPICGRAGREMGLPACPRGVR
jgi:hypothetical protein